MKRRSNIEIQIRNALSGLFILSLKSTEKSALLHSIFCLCRLIKKRGQFGVKLTDLLEQQDAVWLQLNSEEILDRLDSIHIFELDSKNYIQIGKGFKNHLPDICDKVGKYWEFISGLYSKGETFEGGIKSEIKKGVLLFNEGFYFECHEFLEEVWKREKGKEKFFIQGLIHSAVAFYHLGYENYKGTLSYLKRSYRRLKPFGPVFLSVDVKTLLADMEGYLASLEKSDFDNLEPLKSASPKIRLID